MNSDNGTKKRPFVGPYLCEESLLFQRLLALRERFLRLGQLLSRSLISCTLRDRNLLLQLGDSIGDTLTQRLKDGFGFFRGLFLFSSK